MTIQLTGTLTCSPETAHIVRAALPDHIRLSRAEPGCIRFDVTEKTPGIFTVSEEFVDQTAFDAHQKRTRESVWWATTQHMPRDFKVTKT